MKWLDSIIGLNGHKAEQTLEKILWLLDAIGEGKGIPLQYSFAWKIPWTEEPGRLQSMGSLRVGHD